MTTATMDVAVITDLSVGQKCEDGTIYLGYHLDPKDGQKKDWFTTAEDAKFEGTKSKGGERLELNFNQAASYVKKLAAHDHNDWQCATDNILVAQFNARNTGAFADTYDYNRNFPRSRYLSKSMSPVNPVKAIARSFVDGKEELIDLGFVGFLRPVRSVPRP